MALCGKIGLDMTEFTSSQSILVLSLERLVSNSYNTNLDLSLLDKMLSTRPSLALYQSYKHRNELPNILARHYNPNSKVVVGYKVSWPDEKILQMSLSEFMKVELDDNLAKHSLILILSKNSSL
jgi:precorrin-4/cobalt-precorrin-4 C11-methyltransferase